MCFLTWISAWSECIKRNLNFTQMIRITPKGQSTIEWWFTYPHRASTMVRIRHETLTTYYRQCLYDECIALNSTSSRILINYGNVSAKIVNWTWHPRWSNRNISMKSSGLMLNHRLISMHCLNAGWDKTSYSKDKSGRPCLYDQHPVVTHEPKY